MDTAGRDQALHRLSRLTRWSVGAAVALTGAFSVLVAHARPGHSVTTTATNSTPSTPSTTTPSNGDGVLQPPAQVPTRSSGRGLATSGAT
ncbi:MAG TPA: hypothetical protein VHT30_04765 [Acidimicrobiales bacterium]|nr:hypothetical protein [Acidimicrobiales bacterium]